MNLAQTHQQKRKSKRFYIKDQEAPFEEDATHEFKAHRNLCVEELPPWTQEGNERSRRAASRALNGFLNTGRGGTVYLGIMDDGMVKGLNLNLYQKDHVIASLDDLMKRYNPPVEEHRYKVRFIPVIETEEQFSSLALDEPGPEYDKHRLKPHHLRATSYCWCDNESVAKFNIGILSLEYVIEVTIKPWDPNDPRNMKISNVEPHLHPIHENEEGIAFFRRQASLVQVGHGRRQYSLQEIWTMTKQEVTEYYQPQIDRLKEDLAELRRKAS